MLSNVGNTIQKLINNTPVAVTLNETTTSIVTNGGNLYQSGLVGSTFRQTFEDSLSSDNIAGKVIDAEAIEDKVYLLNSTGSVFSYGYGKNGCDSIVREIYSPAACGGDKATHISSGRAHVVILTENNKVWGAGSNEQYQLVPQGQCKYDTAVELFITDTNLHDNDSCKSFVGLYNEMSCPVIPKLNNQCNDISCVKNTRCDTLLGYLDLHNAVVSPPCTEGILSIPIYGDISYVGFLCVDDNNCASGTLTWTISRIYVKCGCFVSKFTYNDQCGCHVREFNTSSTTEVVIFDSNQCPVANTNTCCPNARTPLSGTSQIIGKCGDCVVVNIDLSSEIELPSVSSDEVCKTVLLSLYGCTTSLTGLCDTSLINVDPSCEPNLELDVDVQLDCCRREKEYPNNTLPQPCWTAVYAGQNISVLKDSCNRLYALGSLYEIRSNKNLIQGSCLQDLLNYTHASVTFPADQLNCSGNSVPKNKQCECPKCQEKEFETDLSKFGVHLSFPGQNNCDKESMNVCDFLNRLKNCNEAKTCEPTCEPSDGYIYLDVAGKEHCGVKNPTVGSVTLLNKKSVTKLVSQGCPDVKCLSADLNTIIEFDLNKYCIDTTDVPLDRIVKIQFCNDGPNINLYLDIDMPGGIKFTDDSQNFNVEFAIDASSRNHQFLLNFGSIMDPVELTNLKYALSLDCYYPSSQYKNPFDTKITNTYLRRGDRVKFVTGNPKNIRLAVTADIPTVFRLNRRVVDVAIGQNNMTVLAGGLSSPNELFALGNNCKGELGLGNYETVVCFKKLNRCQFDCQVSNIFAGAHVTFYGTQSHHIYAAGQWKDIVNCNTPTLVRSICQSWKIKQIAISTNHIILLSSDGCVFGLGDNKMGELGLKHNNPVCKPLPLAFFYRLNDQVANKLSKCFENPCGGIYPRQQNRTCESPQTECQVWEDELCRTNPSSCSARENRFPRLCRPYRPNNRVQPCKNYKY